MRAEVINLLREGEKPSPAVAMSAGITALVLAGQRDTRFGEIDKALIPVAGRALIKRVLEQLVMQVQQIVVVAGANSWVYASQGCKVVAHENSHPLSAIAAGLAAIDTSHALVVPGDAARLPRDLGSALWQAQTQHGQLPCYVRASDRAIPECALIARSERASIEQAFHAGRTLADWLTSRQAVQVDYSDWPAEFWGLRDPNDVRALEAKLRR